MYYGSTGMMGACTYGIDLGLPLPIPIPLSGTVTSEQMTLPADQGYTFTFFVQADIAAAANADLLSLEVLESGAATEVWSKADLGAPNIGPTWSGVTLDLSAYAGKTISLRYSFDNLSANPVPGGKGVFLDDLSLTADCNPE